ncbi:MAG: EI24 domain-containing protein [Betaproteobacteria bacterium]
MSPLQAFWRALATVTQPRVWAWALPPLGVVLLLVGTLGWALWEPSLDAVRALVGRFELSDGAWRWMHDAGLGGWRTVLAPVVVVVLALPLVLLLSLLAVALLAAPGIARHVAGRRHPALQVREGCGLLRRLLWTAATALAALLALVASLPLWLVPPLVLVLPPLIWGWLAARVLGYHALAVHATAEERRRVRRGRRLALWAMGVGTGYLALLPALLWSLGSVAFVLAPFFLLAAAFLLVVVFVFAAAWFAHLALDELAALRALEPAPVPTPESLAESPAS